MLPSIPLLRYAVLLVAAAVVVFVVVASPGMKSPAKIETNERQSAASGRGSVDDETLNARTIAWPDGAIARSGIADATKKDPVDGSRNRHPENPSEERFAGFTSSEQEVFKENFYCDLAEQARVTCERADRGDKAYEDCLSLRSYHTYSRHCGYQP